MEKWIDIKGFEGFYEISNFGKVKSLDRIVVHGKSGVLNIKGKVMKPHFKNNGYYTIILQKNKLIKRYYLHRLIADHFIPNPLNKPQINHIDGNPANNSISNLEWSTQKENVIHAVKIGLHKTNPVLQFDMQGNFIKEHLNGNIAALEMSVNSSNIYCVLTGKRKTAYGYIWKYK